MHNPSFQTHLTYLLISYLSVTTDLIFVAITSCYFLQFYLNEIDALDKSGRNFSYSRFSRFIIVVAYFNSSILFLIDYNELICAVHTRVVSFLTC